MNMSWPNCVEALRGGRGKGCIDEVLGGKESMAIFFKDAAELGAALEYRLRSMEQLELSARDRQEHATLVIVVFQHSLFQHEHGL